MEISVGSNDTARAPPAAATTGRLEAPELSPSHVSDVPQAPAQKIDSQDIPNPTKQERQISPQIFEASKNEHFLNTGMPESGNPGI